MRFIIALRGGDKSWNSQISEEVFLKVLGLRHCRRAE